jgi:K+-sensing histidine kinase KdpD
LKRDTAVSQHTIIGVQATENQQIDTIEAEISEIAQRHGLDVIKSLQQPDNEVEALRQKLAAANAQIEQYKTSFGVLASMSHEIRSPIGTIMGNSEMLLAYHNQSMALVQDETEHLNQITQAGNDLLELINDFVDFNRIQIEKLTLYLEAFEVNSLIEFVNNTDLVKDTTIKLNVTQDADIGMMYSDPVRVQQVLLTGIKIATRLAAQDSAVDLNVSRHITDSSDFVQFYIHCPRNPVRKMDWIFERGIRWPLIQNLCHLMQGEVTRGSATDTLEITIRLPAEVKKPTSL